MFKKQNSFLLFAVIFFTSKLLGNGIPEVLDPKKIRNFIFLPLIEQEKDYTCGVAAMRSILQYYGDFFDEDTLEDLLQSDKTHGTLSKNIIKVAKNLQYTVQVFEPMNFTEIETLIRQEIPVLVMFQAWAKKPVKDWQNEWNEGHFAIIVGFDRSNFYFMDPANHGKYTYLPKHEFLLRWHDLDGPARTYQFGMIIYKNPITHIYTPIDPIQ